MVRNRSIVDKILMGFIYIFLIGLSLCTILPLLQVITISVSPTASINKYGFHLIPSAFDFGGYIKVFHTPLIWVAYKNTMIRTILGTTITILLTFLAAYPLSKRKLPNRKFWTGLILITMFFSGGMIPSYLLIKNIGLMNSVWALVLPGAINTFMLLVVRSFILALPESLEESAKIDGANDIRILIRIVIPLSMPILATVGLYSAVAHWNAWFDSMIYTQDQNKWVLQLVLRHIILDGQAAQEEASVRRITVNSDTMKMATLVVSILPIICTYPFLQKYFIKGTLIGSVKG